MSFRKNSLIHLALIFSLGLLVYSNTLDAPFIFDDMPNIVGNCLIRNLSNVPVLFAGGTGPFASRPLMHAALALNYHFGGLDPTGYHAVNIALHLINASLLYFLILMTGRFLRYDDESARPVALLASLLFVAHPVHTDAVTYVVSRSMLLVTMFYLSGIMLFAKAATAGRPRWLYITLLLIVSLLGAASREDFITFPLMLLLYDLFFISGFKIKEALGRWRLYIAVLPACAYLIYLTLNNTYDPSEGYSEVAMPPLWYALSQLNVHWTYLRLLLLPINQNLDYDYPTAKTLFELPTAISSLGYLGLWAGVVMLARRRPAVSFGALWFLVALLPISFVLAFVGEALELRLGDVIFEHRLYLPSAGLIAGFAALAVYAAREMRLAWARKTVALCLVLIVASLPVAAYKRNRLWQSGISLWGDVVKKSPRNTRALINLANSYSDAGILDESIRYYHMALNSHSLKVPSSFYTVVYVNLANNYYEKGLIDKAIKYYETAIALDSKYSSAYHGLGNAYMEKGLIDKAIENYRTAIQLDPQLTLSYNALGNAYLRKGLTDEAIENYKSAVHIDPRYAVGYNNLGVAYVRKGLNDMAIEYYEMAITIDPQYAKAYGGLGNAYLQQGTIDRAIEYYRQSLRLNPKDPYAHRNLGVAYLRIGRTTDAQVHFKTADSLLNEAGGPESGDR